MREGEAGCGGQQGEPWCSGGFRWNLLDGGGVNQGRAIRKQERASFIYARGGIWPSAVWQARCADREPGEGSGPKTERGVLGVGSLTWTSSPRGRAVPEKRRGNTRPGR